MDQTVFACSTGWFYEEQSSCKQVGSWNTCRQRGWWEDSRAVPAWEAQSPGKGSTNNVLPSEERAGWWWCYIIVLSDCTTHTAPGNSFCDAQRLSQELTGAELDTLLTDERNSFPKHTGWIAGSQLSRWTVQAPLPQPVRQWSINQIHISQSYISESAALRILFLLPTSPSLRRKSLFLQGLKAGLIPL